MQDQYQRVIDYLRISVTDRCNLRCVYCMPEQEKPCFLPEEEILTDAEILRLLDLFAGVGISKVKFTGGEPLLRKGLPELISRVGQIPGIQKMTLTTNGMLLKEEMEKIYKAGITSVNISLDAVTRTSFMKITGLDYLEQVMEGIDKARQYPVNVKLNCVLAKELNQDQWISLAGLAKDAKMDVRFIEMMPLGAGKDYVGSVQDELLSLIEKQYGVVEEQSKRGNGPAVYYKVKGFLGRIGFISAISHKFCSQCNRIRLTADGLLKPCLQYQALVNLKDMMRDGCTDEELGEQIKRTIYQKPREHQFGKKEIVGLEHKQMSEIGG